MEIDREDNRIASESHIRSLTPTPTPTRSGIQHANLHH
jgi:hypothetical protein